MHCLYSPDIFSGTQTDDMVATESRMMTSATSQTDVVTLCSGETQTYLETCDYGTQMENAFVDGATQTLPLSLSDDSDSSDDESSSSNSGSSSTPIQPRKQPVALAIWGKGLKCKY
jgi:hypothetical protein